MDFVDYAHTAKAAIDRFRDLMTRYAAAAAVPACALAAIVERESGGNPSAISADGGYGLCQITSGVDAHGVFTQTGANMRDPASNLETAARFSLAPAIAQCTALRSRYATQMNAVSPEILFFAFCAYNAGFGSVQAAVQSGVNPDDRTTNRYGAGTLALYHSALAASHAALTATH